LGTRSEWDTHKDQALVLGGNTFPGLGYADGGHVGGGGGLDAYFGVFEDEALGGVYVEAVGGEEEGFGAGLAVGVVAGADEGVEEVKDVEGGEGFDDGLVGAAGDDGEGELAVVGVDDFEDFGDGF
jgi:hypothetical protein